MDADERAELLRVVRLLCGLAKDVSPDDLAERIVNEIDATGWNVTRPIRLKPEETEKTKH